MTKQNLLIEIGTEELPPKSLRTLAVAFADNMQLELNQADINFDQIKWLASPRRLALIITAIDEQQQDKIVEKKGPAIQAAFDSEGNPTKAALGWCRGNNIDISEAERLETDKGAWLLHKAKVQGQLLTTILTDMVNTALAKLPIAKPMRWGAGSTQFIRPVHSIIMMLGSTVIDGIVLGKQSSNQTQGHRFHSPGLHQISSADSYEAELLALKVVVDFETRKEMIKTQLMSACDSLNAVPQYDNALLDEVSGLVEWPVALVGSFEEKFLAVPSEALMYSMIDNQKYFPLKAQNGQLLNKFVFISNIESRDPAQVIAGNEKVVRPRLADAEFFFETDKKTRLESRLTSLETVLFQKQLGTLKDKSDRIATLAGQYAELIDADVALAHRAGLLSKTDLMTDMVMEFPEIQGVMGRYYAQHDGEPDEVATALFEQYLPRYSGDSLPNSAIACAVSLADKFDTLVGIFGIGQIPKGDKDPFALRRAAIGSLRIMMEKSLPLDIVTLAELAKAAYGDKLSNDNVVEDVTEFLFARFRAWYTEQGIKVDTIQAVLARRPQVPSDFNKRIAAVDSFRQLSAAGALAAANKRVSNILAKFDGTLPAVIDTSLLIEPAEINLAQAVSQTAERLEPAFAACDYTTCLTELAELRQVTDEFFDHVMVMADDENTKLNRLLLLSNLRSLFLRVADISLLQS